MPTIHELVAERIGASGPTVQTRVIDALVEKELMRRSDAIIRAFQEIDKLNAEIRKTKPDNVAFDVDGNKLSETYSKASVEKIKKAKENIVKVQKAIDKALEKNDFGDLYNKLNLKKEGEDPAPVEES